MDTNYKTTASQINPEYLGSVLVNGIYYDKKTAKFNSLKDIPIETTTDKDRCINESFYTKFLNLFNSKK